MAKKPSKSSKSAVNLDPSMRIVVLHGEERFLIEEYTRRFTEMLEEKFGGLEVFIFEGETVDPAAVLDELRSYGLMQKHKLVILDNAESFLAGGGRGATEERDEDEPSEVEESSEKQSPRRPMMERYAENPAPDATLLMRARSWRPGKLDKLIAKVGLINVCKSPDEGQAIGWCMGRCLKRYDAKLEPDAAELLVGRIGTNLLRLDTELTKLAAMAGATKVITRQIVAEAVGLSREEKAWQIQNAVVTADAGVMLRKLRELLDISQQDEVPITWAIIDLLRRMHAASQLLAQNTPPQALYGRLRLFGPAGEATLRLARNTPSQTLAQLLHEAIQTDVATKTGLGDPQRRLETLLVTIADKLQPRAA